MELNCPSESQIAVLGSNGIKNGDSSLLEGWVSGHSWENKSFGIVDNMEEGKDDKWSKCDDGSWKNK